MNNIYDVIISGAGPTGTLLGYLLSKNGIRTLIIEKEIFPRLKVCAGGVQHRILDLIPFKLDPVIEKTISGIYFSFANRDVFFKRYDAPVMYTVDRRKFDDFLAKKAKESGCQFNFGEKTTGYNTSNNYVEVITSSKKYKTKVLAGADGINGTVHRRLTRGKKINRILGYVLELPYVKTKENNIIPARNLSEEHINSKYIISDKNSNTFDLSDSIRLDFNSRFKGYCWVFPKNNFFSIGIGASFRYSKFIKRYFNDFLNDFYFFNKRGQGPSNILAHSIPIKGKNVPIKEYRVLSVGDAACIADGFTGEGLYNGFKSSIIAYDSINLALKRSSYDFYDYDKKIDYDIYDDIRQSIRITKIFYSYSLFFYKLIKKNDNYFNACCRLLRGEKTYKDAFRRLGSLNLKK